MADAGPSVSETDFSEPKSFSTKYTVLVENVIKIGGSRYHSVTEEQYNKWDKHRRSKARKRVCMYRENVLKGVEKLTLKGAEHLLKYPALAADLGLQRLAEERVEIHRQSFHLQHQPNNEDTVDKSSSTPSTAGGIGVGGFGVVEDGHVPDDAAVARVLNDEVLPDQIGLVELTPQQLEVLAFADTANANAKYSFNRLLSHWSVTKMIPQASVDYFLELLHRFRPELEFQKLPKSCKTLLKKDSVDYGKGKIREITIPTLKGRERCAVYLHFGIKSALFGTSPGLTEKWQWIQTLRRAYSIFPHLIPEEFIQVIKPQKGEEYNKNVLREWNLLPCRNQEESVERDLVVQIHGHIDGVQWYKNSGSAKGVPILGRVVGFLDAKSGDHVRISTLAPFVIGVMQVYKKTPTHMFVRDFVKELETLSHQRFSGLSFRVELTCMICDAPQRAECKGIVQHGGHYACERCRTRGHHSPSAGTVVYPDLSAAPRLDSKWKNYLVKERNETKKDKTHRKKDQTPMFEDVDGRAYVPFNYVSGFALESMHLVDGGVLRDLLITLSHMATVVRFEPHNPHSKQTYSVLESDMEEIIKCYKRFGLSEMSRQLRSLTLVDKFKMRECHVFFMYYAYFIFEPFAEDMSAGIEMMAAMKHLLVALHLVKGFSAKPLTPEVLDIAQFHIERFLEAWKAETGDDGMKFKFHEMFHMLQDARKHGCCLEFLSAYVYENFHGKWKHLLRNGRLPISQIRNRLIEIQKYKLPVDATGLDSLVLTEKQTKYMREHKVLELPPDSYLYEVSPKTRGCRTAEKPLAKKTLKYMAFELSNIFPQNICIMRDGNVVFCHDFLWRNDVETPFIEGYKFNARSPVYETPYDSRDIGMLRVSDVSAVTEFWGADDVATKCIMLPCDITQKIHNPVPDSIRLADKEKMTAAYNEVYENSGSVWWNVHGLLVPPQDVRDNMCL